MFVLASYCGLLRESASGCFTGLGFDSPPLGYQEIKKGVS